MYALQVLLFVFIGVTAGLVLYVIRNKDMIMMARVRRQIESVRRHYLKTRADAIQDNLRSHELIVYLDKELDDSHEEQRLLYKKNNMFYGHYPETSLQRVWLKGHDVSLSIELTRELVHHFCISRLLLFQVQLDRSQDISMLIIRALYRLMIPRLDSTAMKEKRRVARLKEEEQQH